MAPRVDILTLFPELIESFAATSIVSRAAGRGLIDIHITNIRDFATDNYGSVDDSPYGGGPGMVLMCQPIFDAVDHVRQQGDAPGQVVLLSPQGRPFDQALADDLARRDRLILLCGHYEGFDERIRTDLADEEISMGDFVLSGGEVPAMAIVDAIARLQPGALGKDESTTEESHRHGLLEYPQYTRPREYRGLGVPEVLLGGNHAKITAWRKAQAEQRTRTRRPDLWEQYLKNQPTDPSASQE